MPNELIVSNVIDIYAPPATVWDALVTPAQTKKYMFGCEAISDWKIGSSLLWKGEHQGNEMIFVKGTVVAIVPGKHLAYTTIDPNNPKVADVPENYLTVTYTLELIAGGTQLTVTQGDYAKVGEGEARYRETVDGGGWQPILEQIKKLVESATK